MNNRLSWLRHLLDKCCKHERLIIQIHAHSTTLGLLSTHQPFTSKLLNTYSKLGNPIKAHSVFNLIRNPDLISWTCLISVYLNNQCPSKAFSVFSDMISLGGFKPDGHSVVAALSSCGSAKDLIGGKIVHGMVSRFELGFESIVGNALIDMYCRNGCVGLGKLVFDGMGVKDVASWTSLVNGFVLCGDIVSARRVFDEMPVRNVISWTAMIVGYVRGKSAVVGLELFREMRRGGDDVPTEITIVAVLSGCADIGALDFGRCVHGYVNKLASLVKNVAVNNALIDNYSKGGSLKIAIQVFREMTCKDVFSWTTIISGLAMHGKGRYALEVFDEMLHTRLVPNEVTFLSVLLACGHSGLVREGQSLFIKLVHNYGFKPRIEHYGCMVDLLSRAGCLEEALELIEQMPIKPDAVIWRSLLSGCIRKGDLELAEIAGKKVLELEPNDDGVYILLWNMFRSKNKWEDALRTRKMMRNQQIKKKPGCSWIEVNGGLHEFIADDSLCDVPTIADDTMCGVYSDMYVLLEALNRQLVSIHDDQRDWKRVGHSQPPMKDSSKSLRVKN